MAFLCIDLGGTNTLIGVGNDSFEISEKITTTWFLNDIQDTLTGVIHDSGYESADIETVAVAAAGPIDRAKGVFYPPNIPLESIRIQDKLSFLDSEFKLLNDCNAAILGEYRYGGHDSDDIVYVTISTGIGAGVLLDGRIAEGHRGNIGEVGHITVGDNNLSCGCGGSDHWEAYCSGSNLPRMADALLGYKYNDSRQIFLAYNDGSSRAKEVIELMNRYNARGMSNILFSYDPEVVLLGGGVALNHTDVVLDGIRDGVRDLSVDGSAVFEVCALRDESTLHGLRAVCMEPEDYH